MTVENEQPQAPRWYVPEALATWFVPGLGHYLIGEKKRGWIMFASVFGIWFLGLLIGGIAIFDRHAPSAPIVRKTQYGMGSSLVAEYVRANYFQPINLVDPEMQRPNRWTYVIPINRMEEQGVLFAAVAGLLNIMLMIDVIYRTPRKAPQGQRSAPAKASVSKEAT